MMFLNTYVRAKVFVGDVKGRVRDRFTDETGAVAAEYGLLIALIAIVMAAGALILGKAINDKFNSVSDSIKNA